MLSSRDGKVNVRLLRHRTSYDLVQQSYSAASASCGLRWSNFFNLLALDVDAYSEVNGPNDPDIGFLSSQALFVVTATTNVFAATDVGRVLMFYGGQSAVITVYGSPTSVTVDTSQTVAASTLTRMAKVLGRDISSGASEIRSTVLAVVRPSYIVNPDNRQPVPVGWRSYRDAVGYEGPHILANRVAAYLNGYNQYRGFDAIGTLDSAYWTNPITAFANLNIEGWHIVAITHNNRNYGIFVDGVYTELESLIDVPTLGMNQIASPAASLSTPSTNPDLDFFTSSNGWPMSRVATLMAFDKQLSQGELLDLYGMLKFGNGYAISRENLVSWWVCRRDSLVTADITTLPAYSAYNIPRTKIPDMSGRGNYPRLYADKVDWTELLGGDDSDPDIYLPAEWNDSNLVYDGVNNYTKPNLSLGGYGIPTFS